MASYYDSFDYPSYWAQREYEHRSEVTAIGNFLQQIPEIDRLLDLGGGYGRLIPTYSHRAKRVVLVDPSKRLLAFARTENNALKNIKYVQSTIQNTLKKFKPNSFDAIIMIRVMHHLQSSEEAIKILKKLLKPNGYLILEFANKVHIKQVITKLLRGDLTFAFDIFNIDKRSQKAKKQKTIDFYNFHPGKVEQHLVQSGFKILAKRSVSNFRHPFFKKNIPVDNLVKVEGLLQKPLSYLNFGPSIFILAKKKG